MINKILLIIGFISIVCLYSVENQAGGEQNVQEFIIHHVVDGNQWQPLPFHLLAVEFPSFNIGGFEFKNGLHATMLLLAGIFIFLFFGVFYKKDGSKAPRGITNALESVVLFVRDDICVNYLGKDDGRKFAPLFLNFFFFILALNLMSLIPLFSTATSNINVTAGLGSITLSSMFILGMVKHGPIGFFKLFIPSGVPVPVLFILFPIEFVGFFVIKPVALSIRLFANMLAGHLIIFSILSLIFTFGIFGVPSVFLALFVYMLEILVAFLQAFIFTMLSAIFIGEVLHPQH